MKTRIIAITLVLCVAFSVAAFADGLDNQQVIKVILDGNQLSFDVDPMLVSDRTMVPLRAIGEAIGVTVDWNEQEQKITMTKGEVINVLVIGQTTATKITPEETTEITLDVPPMVVEYRTLVPLRYVSESFEIGVEWIEETNSVILTTPKVITGQTGPGDTPDTTVTGPGPAGTPSTDLPLEDAEKIAKLKKTARYTFEQSALPQNMFSNEKDIGPEIINKNEEDISSFVSVIWQGLVDRLLMEMMLDSTHEYKIGSEKDLEDTLAGLRQTYKLNDTDMFTLKVEDLGDGTSAIILDMAEAGNLLDCAYIAITYSTKQGMNVFTLEASFGDSFMFCGITRDARGSYAPVENDRKAFIDKVKSVLGSGKQMSATTQK